MYKAIIFDFDYTLADSSKGVNLCINYAFQKLNYQSFSLEDTNKTIGQSLDNSFIILTGNNNPEIIARFKKLFIEKADLIMSKNTYIYESLPKTLKILKNNKIIIGIVSTKFRYRIIEILNMNKLNNYIDLIIGAEDVSCHKPNSEGVLKFIDFHELYKNDCVYIGDSIVDAETAKNSEIDFIAILTGTTKKEDFYKYNPKMFLYDIYDIIKNEIWWRKRMEPFFIS